MPALLDIRGLSYAYPDGTPALRDVGFSLAAGERAALVGPNGAGKSTLVLALGGFLPAGGSVLAPGEASGAAHSPRRGVGVVFQDPDDQLFMPTIFDDVAFGPVNQGLPEGEVRARVADILGRLGLAGMEKKAPHHLSAGQKKIAAIAAVLAMRPEILILDEPMADLDARGRRRLADILEGLPCVILLTAHDISVVPAAFRRGMILDEGRIVFDGTMEALRADRMLLGKHGLEA
ncbi:MAG: energy-coupling factor ABC transporter ATP-binding protein [Planctomycetota bacterium]